MKVIATMYGLVKDFIDASLKGIKTHKKGIAILMAICFVFFFGVSVIMYNISNSPTFCSSCHNMDPYVESWKVSSHKDISCVTCHYKPGFLNHLKGKFKDGQVSMVYFITGKNPGKYHAEIHDSSCLQSGCHERSKLPDNGVYKTIRFSHSRHLSQLRRGKKLRCTTCHGQIVQGAHLKVDPEDCFICHFKVEKEGGKETPSPISECTLCHKEVPEEIPLGDHIFFHGRYVRDGVPCLTCHKSIIEGKGDIVPGKCKDCHNEPDMTETKFTSEILHQNHVADHKVECHRCHESIKHKIQRIPTIKKFDQSCLGCHENRQHLGPREMYQGVGGLGVPDSPSPMSQANVDCMSCHERPMSVTSTIYSVETPDFSIRRSCNSCHGNGYDQMVDRWKNILQKGEKIAADAIYEAEKELVKSKGEGRINPAVLERARALLGKSRHDFTFVTNAQGVHNINYALRLLEKSVEWAEQARSEAVPGYKPRKIELVQYGCTTLCHVDQETKTVPFRPGIEFPHEPHVVGNEFGCNECHGQGVDHGRVIFQACNECHHGDGEGRATCQDCHENVAKIFQGKAGKGVPPMPSVKAENMECVNCHTEVLEGKETTFDGIRAACGECHDEDKEKYQKMAAVWKEEAKTFLASLNKHREQVLNAIHKAELLKQNVILARNQLTLAEHNMKIIGKENGLHNIEYAKKLAEATHKFLNNALEELKRGK
ncbi:MAG: ammonia-forming cytochrome c nitrite reductase subunit c552 [Desulfatiglandales bacterium]